MSHEIAHFLLDFAAKTSVCGATTERGAPRKFRRYFAWGYQARPHARFSPQANKQGTSVRGDRRTCASHSERSRQNLGQPRRQCGGTGSRSKNVQDFEAQARGGRVRVTIGIAVGLAALRRTFRFGAAFIERRSIYSRRLWRRSSAIHSLA
jgi:hypothetical protein